MAEQIMEANQKADMLVNQLKQLNLSPFEKFLIVHDFCASKPYQANGVEDYNDFNNAMTTDKIVCFGYAEIMKYMCNALGIECELFYCDLPPMAMKHGMHTKGHVINLVRIKDEKYGIDDYYVSDASSDSSEYFSKKGLICYAFAALPLQDLKCGIYDYTYPFIVPREYPQQTKH